MTCYVCVLCECFWAHWVQQSAVGRRELKKCLNLQSWQTFHVGKSNPKYHQTISQVIRTKNNLSPGIRVAGRSKPSVLSSVSHNSQSLSTNNPLNSALLCYKTTEQLCHYISRPFISHRAHSTRHLCVSGSNFFPWLSASVSWASLSLLWVIEAEAYIWSNAWPRWCVPEKTIVNKSYV